MQIIRLIAIIEKIGIYSFTSYIRLFLYSIYWLIDTI